MIAEKEDTHCSSAISMSQSFRIMLSSPLKFDLSTLQSLSASASSTHTSPHSHDRHHNDNHDSGIRNLYEVLEAVNAMVSHSCRPSLSYNLLFNIV
jgi:hypothetical protein